MSSPNQSQVRTPEGDYNTQAPHSALGMRSPVEYRSE
jgi:hypothetical protein